MVEESVNDSHVKNNNNSANDISLISTQQKQNLASWGLPETVLKRYELLGVVSMFPWQVECLSNSNVLSGGNLIYSAPTSAGKTLVAEMLIIKTVLEKKKKAILILPFVSVVREKMFYFQNLLSSSGIRVEGLMGSHSLPGGFKNVDIAVCTIEKANGLVNRLLEEGSLHKVGAVVVDELHLLGDSFRGYILELLLTKILYMCKSNDSVKIQIIGMSATLPNLTLLATWLGAELYRTDFRPVPLKEYLKIGPTVIASGVASTPEQVEQYTNCTLLATTDSDLQNPVTACVKFLEESELIRLQKEEVGEGLKYSPTPLGLACLAASLPPDDGLRLFEELQRARHCFVLDTDLHIIYEVTPYSVCSQWGNLDWLHVLNLWEQLPPIMQRVGELVGVEERFMVRAMRGTMSFTTSKQLQKLSIHRRFYTALALHDLVNEVPLNDVAKKYGCTRGMLQSLQQSAATFAGMVTAFCKRLGWSSVELLISQFQDRLQFGVHRELCDLMKLDGLNGQRARALYDEGITSLADLAIADVCEVENALHKAVPFQSTKELDGETSFETKQRNKQRNVWITGHEGLTEREAATLLISEARSYLQKELGLADAKWDCQGNDSSGFESLSSEPYSHNGLDNTTKIERSTLSCDKTPASTSYNEKEKIMDIEKFCSQTQEESHTESLDIHKSQKCSKNKRKKPTHSFSQRSKTEIVQKVEETEAKFEANKRHSASLISDEDCVLSSPPPNCSKKKNASQMRNSRFYKGRSVRKSGRISRNTSVMKRRNLSSASKKTETSTNKVSNVNKNNVLSKKNDLHENAGSSETDIDFVVQVSSTDIPVIKNNDNVKMKEAEPNRAFKEVPSNSKHSSDAEESIDYFETSLNISEQKLHTETQKYNFEVDSLEKSSSSSSNKISDDVNSKSLFLKTFLSSLRIKETDESNEISKQSINSSLISSPEQIGELEKNIINVSIDSQRHSSDFFCTPQVIEKHTEVGQIEDPSPSLFGDSFIVDSQLDEVLEACDKNNDGSPKDIVCAKETSLGLKNIPTELFPDLDSNLENIKESYNSKKDEKLPLSSATNIQMNKSIKLNVSKNAMKNKINKGNLSKSKCITSLPKGIVTARDVINLNLVLEKENNSELHESDDYDGIENKHTKSIQQFDNMQVSTPTVSNVVKSSADASVNNETTFINSIYSEELLLQSFDEESLLPSPIPKKNMGLFKQKIYNLNKTLRSNLSVKNSIMRKRKRQMDEMVDWEQELDKSKKTKIAEDPFQNKIDCSFSQLLKVQENPTDTKQFTVSTCPKDELEHPNVEIDDGDPISDSFFEKAFNTYWELGTESEENEKNLIQDEKILSKEDRIPSENMRTVGEITHLSAKENKEEQVQDGKISNGDRVFSENMGTDGEIAQSSAENNNINISVQTKNEEHADGVNDDACIITDSLFEGAFSSCWGETENSQEKQDTSKVSQKNCNKAGNNITSYEVVAEVNFENPISSKNEISEKSNICKRRSPRLMEAANQDKKKLKTDTQAIESTLLEGVFRMWDSVNIIEVCGHERIWKAFCTELCSSSTSKVAFAVACEKYEQPTIVNKTGGIGARIIGIKQKKHENLAEKNLLHYNEKLVTGIALCFGGKDIFFISLKKGEQSCQSLQSVLDTIQEFFKRNIFFCAFDLKEHLKTLVRCCRIRLCVTNGHDPKVADWLIEPEGREKSFAAMVLHYCGNEATKLADMVGTSWGVGSPSLDWRSDTPSRLRACVEAFLSWQLVEKQGSALKEKNLVNVYTEVEMPTLLCLTKMELNGIGFDRGEAERLRDLLSKQLTLLEEHAYKLAGHAFSLTSSSDIGKVWKVFVSADYSQLELRILAHLAKDSVLSSILNADCDVFRNIAASWNKIDEAQVTNEQRQWAKQVCYGIIYGMGAKALGVKKYLLETVELCRREGYVETLLGRRRYLSGIHNPNSAIRAQAERQAVNTTVQGSAADVAKKAMVLVDSQLNSAGFISSEMGTGNRKEANLVLHIHDELLYEVSRDHLMEAAHIIKEALENAVKLSVKLPVKVKVGESWGSIKEISL
ncbi:hypothetical protein C0J52_07902 [Blattella germanica]|nr:hypothetical protein C0J52_07902 [Blattella germanica]